MVDVDGVVSPVHPTASPWGDLVRAGEVFGPVLVSPALCARLDALAQTPGVACWWLSSWSSEMRVAMDPFPGREWPAIATPGDYSGAGRTWWKLAALEAWLAAHPEVRALAWCDDHLRGGRPAAVRRRLAAHGVAAALIAPATSVGLTPTHLDLLDVWAATTSSDPTTRSGDSQPHLE